MRLEPQPMTQAEVADMVERTRRAGIPGVRARRTALRRESAPAAVPDAPAVAPQQHVITIESLVSESWVDDNGSPASVIRWVCSCGRSGGEFWPTETTRARVAGAAHAHAATRRQRSAGVVPVAPPARRDARRRTAISVARVGARYAMLAGVTLAEATWVMRAATGGWVTGHSLAREWSRLYPGVPVRVSQRGVR